MMLVPCKLVRTRVPLFVSFSCNWMGDTVAVVQTVVLPASIKTRFPSFERDSFEPFPLTGSSRFAIQITVGSLDLVNQTEKQKALSPTWKNPAEKSPLAETSVSVGFSTERDELSGSVSFAANEVGANKRRRRRKTGICIASTTN